VGGIILAMLWLSSLPLIAADSCDPTKGLNVSSKVTSAPFGKLPEGTSAKLFTITNAQGASMQLTDYGARLVAVKVPDKMGKIGNVDLGLDSAEKYAAHTAYFGCTTGRFANRIGKGRFTLDGKEYRLATTNGPNHLHGGVRGFDKYVWSAKEVSDSGALGIAFSHTSPDGDEGYPGALAMTVTIWLTDANECRIDYAATTDKPTVLNLTNHAYWNLSGAGSGSILKHRLRLTASSFLEVDRGLIPTGKRTSVQGTFMDFTTPFEIGSRFAQTKSGDLPLGYDHCYVIDKSPGDLALCARVEDPASGRVMEVLTTEPAVQLYTANYLDGDAKNGGHQQHAAFCLETQHFPDSPNKPEFPSTVLRPGQTFRSTTVYRFAVTGDAGK
jgi:aldose 1-epimerase